MTRSKALLTMGAMVAGVPLLKRAITDIGNPAVLSGQDTDKVLKDPVLAKAISELEYLTPASKFIVQRRGTPVLTEIPPGKLPAIGLTRETWQLGNHSGSGQQLRIRQSANQGKRQCDRLG